MTAFLEQGLATSPLAEIERRVQERAKRLDVHEETTEGLRAILEDEVERWNVDFQRGLHTFPVADPETVADRALRNLAGYGPLTPLLDDDDVWEIMVNVPDAIFVKRHAGPSGYHDEVFHDDDHVIAHAHEAPRRAPSEPTASSTPPRACRTRSSTTARALHIVHGDIGRGGHVHGQHPQVHRRRLPLASTSSSSGTCSRAGWPRFLPACVRAAVSIVFAGAPGSGKTTLLSCCAAELDPALRVVIAEEVFEADVPLANVAQHADPTRPRRPTGRSTCAGSSPASCAWRPTWPSSARSAIARRCPLLLDAVVGRQGLHDDPRRLGPPGPHPAAVHLPALRAGRASAHVRAQPLVSEAIDIVVHTARTRDGVRATSVIAVEDLASGPDSPRFTVTEVFAPAVPGGPVRWTGELPERLERRFGEQGIAIRPLLAGGDR